MDQQTNIEPEQKPEQEPESLPESLAEAQTSPREELVQAIVLNIRQLFEEASNDQVLARFRQVHPVDQGEALTSLSEDIRRLLLENLIPAETADILEELEPEEAVEVFQGLGDQELAGILDQTSRDVSADILQLQSQERQEAILAIMTDPQEVVTLLQYREDSAGGLMTLDYPVVRETLSTPNAMDQLRLLGPEAENINSILVVDDGNRLVGTLSITRLALARPTAVIGDIADRDTISVTADTDQEECVRLMERYNLIQLPVVDNMAN